eukprot:g12825.t1
MNHLTAALASAQITDGDDGYANPAPADPGLANERARSMSSDGAVQQMNPEFSIPKLGVSVAFLLKFTEKHQKSGKLLPTDSSKDVVEKIIKLETGKAKCSFVDHLAASKDELESKAVQQATHFLSHAWSYIFTDVVAAVRARWPSPQEQTNVFLWFDLFTINQHGTDNIPGAFWFDAFEANVARIGHTILIQSPWTNPVPLTRAWCLWEILCTSRTKSTFEIILPPVEEKSMLIALVTDFQSVNRMLTTVDVANAKAWKLEDQKKILEAVAQTGEGTHGVNKVVIEQLRDWLAKTGKAAIAEEPARLLRSTLSADPVARFEAAHSLLTNDHRSLIDGVASLLRDQGKLVEAEPLYRRALASCEEKLGATHPATLGSVNNLALVLSDQGKLAEAEPLYHRALAGQEEKLGATHPVTLATVNNLAILLSNQGKLAEAEKLYRRALAGREEKLGATHLATLDSISNLADLLDRQGKLAEAEPLYRRALAGQMENLGAMHPVTLASVSNLAWVLSEQGKLAEAEPLYRRALAGQEEKLGVTHPDTLRSANNFGLLLSSQGKLAEAEPLYRRALAGRKEKLGETHPDTLGSVNNLASLLRDQEKLAEAETLYRHALAGREETLGAMHPDTLASVNNLAVVLSDQGKLAEAETMYRRALAVYEKMLGATHPNALASFNNLGILLSNQGKLAEAETMYRRALAGQEVKLGATHPHTLASVKNLANLKKKQGNEKEAKDLMIRAAKGLHSVYGFDHPDTQNAMHELQTLDELAFWSLAASMMTVEYMKEQKAHEDD